MKVGKIYNIDFAKVTKIPRFKVTLKTGDSKRILNLRLLENNTPINLNLFRVTVAAKKKDGGNIFNAVTITDPLNGLCKVELTNQMLNGFDLPCEIVLYGIDKTVASSSNFVIDKVESLRDDYSIVSSDEFTALTEALSDVAFVKFDLQNKRDKTTKISQSDLDTSSDLNKIQLHNLSDSVISAMAGKTPVSPILAKNSVTPEKTTFFELINNNLYDKRFETTGHYVSNTNGELISDNNYKASDFILVQEGFKYYTTDTHNIAFYNKDKQFVSGVQGGFTRPIVVPVGQSIMYMRVTFNSTSKAYIYENENPGKYYEYGDYTLKISDPKFLQSILQNTEIELDNYEFDLNKIYGIKEKKINLFNKNTIIQHSKIDEVTGKVDLVPGFEYSTSDFMKISPDENYCGSDNYHLAFYDRDKNLIKFYTGGSWTNPVKSPIDAYYARICVMGDGQTHMFVKGDKLPLEYKSYTDSIVEIYHKGFKKALESLPIKAKDLPLDTLEAFKYDRINLYNKDDDYVPNTAVDYTNGGTIEAEGYTASSFIEIESGKSYCCTRNFHRAFYNDKKEFISGNVGNTWTSPFVAPEGAKFIRVTFYANDPEAMFVEGTSLPSKYIPYSYKILNFTNEPDRKSFLKALKVDGSNKLQNIKWNVLGDSITSINYSRPSWWEILSRKYNMKVNNYGISGTTLAHSDDRHLFDYDFNKLDANKIGYKKDDSSTWETGNCIVERYLKMNDDADIITVMAGTNDNDVVLGNPTDTKTDTFYGACNTLFEGLIKKYPEKVIGIFTPIQTENCYKTNIVGDVGKVLDSKPPTATISLQLRAEVIKRVAKRFGLPVLDLFNESGFNGVGDRAKYMYRDGLHPSNKGHERLATLIENFLIKIL